MNPAVAAFVGAFAALVALELIRHPQPVLRYLLAFLAGALATLLLSALLRLIAEGFSRLA